MNFIVTFDVVIKAYLGGEQEQDINITLNTHVISFMKVFAAYSELTCGNEHWSVVDVETFYFNAVYDVMLTNIITVSSGICVVSKPSKDWLWVIQDGVLMTFSYAEA